MSARRARKRAALAAIVLAVALWPAVHHALFLRHHIDPWELFGWAMYAVPTERVQVRVELERSGVRTPWRPLGTEHQALRRFAKRRAALGSLVSSAPLARARFAADPFLEAVVVTTRRLTLDPETARLVERDQVERHSRQAIPQPGS